MYYVEENDKLSFFERVFRLIKTETDTVFVPINERYSQNDMERIIKKTIKFITKNSNSKKIILSKKLQKNKLYINYFNSYGFEIVQGKFLSKILETDILEAVIKKQKIDIEKVYLSILINDLTEIEIENIKIIAQKYKRVNIITNHIEKFKRLEEKLNNDYGIMITVTNNKRKSLAKSEIIINVDFPEELINKYVIYENAYIISLNNKIKIHKKRFNGCIINDYEIDFRSDKKDVRHLEDKYYLKDLYESNLYTKHKFEDLRRILKKDKVAVVIR